LKPKYGKILPLKIKSLEKQVEHCVSQVNGHQLSQKCEDNGINETSNQRIHKDLRRIGEAVETQ